MWSFVKKKKKKIKKNMRGVDLKYIIWHWRLIEARQISSSGEIKITLSGFRGNWLVDKEVLINILPAVDCRPTSQTSKNSQSNTYWCPEYSCLLLLFFNDRILVGKHVQTFFNGFGKILDLHIFGIPSHRGLLFMLKETMLKCWHAARPTDA